MNNLNNSTLQHFNTSTTNDTAIRVNHVSKKYCKSLKRSMLYGVKDIGRNILGMSSHSDKLRKNEFWALNDVSFELKKGETLGIIGPNGSGKTSLLKMLNGIFWPDKGKITTKGKVGALIEVGAGFHLLLTGRENVYINAAILGMAKKEVDKKFDSIVEFADIGDFLDTPVKYYSSGMFVRLGFAVAVHAEPDILLVDEVLAVGDMNFQRKCFETMKSKIEEGMSLVLVTHSMHSLLGNVEKTILLNNGKMHFMGPTKDAVSLYVEESNRAATYGHLLTATRRGSGEARIIKACIVDEKGNEIIELPADSSIRIQCSLKVNRPISNPIFFFTIRDAISREIVLFGSSANLFQIDSLEKDSEFEFVFEKPKLGPRRYYLCGGIVVKGQYNVPVDMWDDAGEQFVIKFPEKIETDELYLLHNSITRSPYRFEIEFKN